MKMVISIFRTIWWKIYAIKLYNKPQSGICAVLSFDIAMMK